MGKSLIIPGADFSVNGIPNDNAALYSSLAESLNIGDGLSTVQGGTVVISSANAGMADVVELDLSPYYQLGYSQVKINVNNTDYSFILILGSSLGSSGTWNCYDANGNTVSFIWQTTASLKGAISSNSKLSINVKRVDGGNISDTTVLSDIITSVELS